MRTRDLKASLWNLPGAVLAVAAAGCADDPLDEEPGAGGYQAAYLEVDDPTEDCGVAFEVAEIARPLHNARSLTFMDGDEAAQDIDGDGREDLLVREGTRFFVHRGGDADCRTELDDLRFATAVALGDLNGNGHLEIAFNDGQVPVMVEVRPKVLPRR